jgi:electron transfer flavoprotein alpha subunit
MPEILVVAEQRAGELREITLQMLSKAADLCDAGGLRLCAVVVGREPQALVEALNGRADQVIVYDAPELGDFEPGAYAAILAGLMAERKPLLTLLGHTPWGMDLAPALAEKTGCPLATDCVDVLLEAGRPKAVRQVYGGKLFCRAAFRQAEGYLATVRAGSFPVAAPGGRQTEVTWAQAPAAPAPRSGRESLGIEDAAKGDVDITQADLLVSIGRGIGEEDNIESARELAALMGGMLSCSRPVVDKKWLPKYHQVGTSGKTVRPKVYLALGISGAFQHVAGMSGSGTIIAVNKDKKAPIFRVAGYGAVADVMAVIAALKARLAAR